MSSMFRTKHLFVFLVIGAFVVVAVGMWIMVRDRSGTSSDTHSAVSTFLNAPESTYGVIVATDEVQKEKNSAFIERIREALKKELPTVIESHIESESEIMSEEQNIELTNAREEFSEETVAPSTVFPIPTSETYEASNIMPLSTTTSTTTEPSIGSE